jgi:hypothetical protein
MDQAAFWKIIDAYVSDDKLESEYGYAEFAERLEAMSRDDILEFASAMRRALNTAHTWDMWGAAYLVCGGCAEEGFAYFCGWLMAQGSEVFRQAVDHPDSLAEYLPDYEGDDVFEDEAILAAPLAAFEEKTGSYEGFVLTERPASEPEGEQWDIEEQGELEARLPKLYAYLIAEEGDGEDEEESEEEEL